MHINIDGKKIDTAEFAEFCDLGLMQDGVTVRKEAREAYPFHFGNWVTTSLVAVTESGAYVLTPRGADLRASLASFPVEPKAEPPKGKACSDCNGEGKKPLLVSFYECERCKGSKVEPETAVDKISRWAAALATGRISLPKSDDSKYFTVQPIPYGYRISGGDFTLITRQATSLDNLVMGELRRQEGLVAKALGYNPISGYAVEVDSGRTSSRHPNTDLLPREEIRIGDGRPWTLIDSEETASSFVGKVVEIDAPAGGTVYNSAAKAHGRTALVTSADHLNLDTKAGDVDWPGRGNVRLRLAPPQVQR